jgi:hypothetical protein
MRLAYRDDWPEAAERLRALWAREPLGRPAMLLTCPREHPIPGPPAPERPADMLARWTGANYLAATQDHALRQTAYLGEAAPSLFLNLGPGCLSACFGARPTYAETTVWFDARGFDYEPLQLGLERPYCRMMLDLTRSLSAELRGKGLLGMTDLGDATDVLAALRGTEALLVDLIERPDDVERALGELTCAWIAAFEALHAAAEETNGGGIQWLALWAPGPMYVLASDFSCMISPADFERFVAPEIERLAAHIPHTIYHLDGPDAVRHLDRVLAVEGLGGVQWVPGEGRPSAVEWMPLLRRVQDAGKMLQVFESPGNVERLCRELRPEGLIIYTWCASESEGRELLRDAERWSAAR